jgi:hypothetical protein
MFHKLAQEQSTLIRFSARPIASNYLNGEVLEIQPSAELVEFSMKIAEAKSTKTMALNQNLKIRTEPERVSNLLRGILGETAIQVLLSRYLETDLNDVLRFDLERATFDYVATEYDLSFRGRRIEVRTSNNNFDSNDTYVNSRDKGIICRYTNQSKTTEAESDYYFAVVYDYPGFRGAVPDSKRIQFSHDVVSGKLKMYLLAGANSKEKQQHGKFSTLGQTNTTYELINFSQCRPLRKILDEMKGLA